MKKRILPVALLVCLLSFSTLFASCRILSQKLISADYETYTYPAEGEFTKIEIDTRVTDVTFALAEDGETRVVCEEPEELHHTVKVEDETLKIALEGTKSWSFYTKDMTMVVYLPATEYDSLRVENRTGDISIPAGFSFEDLAIEVSTGSVEIVGASAKKMNLISSTGKISLAKVTCEGTISISVSTGKALLNDVTCKNLNSTGSTGNLELCDVVASESFSLKRSTGNIHFERCDAEAITVETSTGKVVGTLRSDKIFIAKSSTGSVNVPETISGGVCKITTSTGRIEIEIEE